MLSFTPYILVSSQGEKPQGLYVTRLYGLFCWDTVGLEMEEWHLL